MAATHTYLHVCSRACSCLAPTYPTVTPIAIAMTAIVSVRYNNTQKPPSHSNTLRDQGALHAFEHVNRREMHLFAEMKTIWSLRDGDLAEHPDDTTTGDLLTIKLFTTI